ncbi:hypothetical protein JCM19029_05010 [Salinicoccus sesuvii]
MFSAAAIGFRLVQTGAQIPELTLSNMHPDNLPIFPLLFFTITCGALSGFHATQSPIISRTTAKESNGRQIFYGMQIAEGIIAMVWAAAAMSIFDDMADWLKSLPKVKRHLLCLRPPFCCLVQ